jgi:hypothetical protein
MLPDGARDSAWRPTCDYRVILIASGASVADQSLNGENQTDQTNQTNAEESGAETADTQDESDYEAEGATPPGYDEWPTHGGYLGCLIAVMFACLLAPLGYILVGFLGAFLSRPLGGFGVAVAIVITAAAYIAVFIGLVRLGWSMGKRYLREYPEARARVTLPPPPDTIVDADNPPAAE